jgi:DNA modification methylase
MRAGTPTADDVIRGDERWCVITGDCLDVLPDIAAKSVPAVITDPPYAVSLAGVAHVGQPGKGTRRLDFFEGDSDWDETIRTVVRMATEAVRIMSDAASFYAYVGHREFGPLVTLFERAGWSTRFLVWAKAAPAPPPPGSGWPSGAELCLYAYRPGRTWNHDGSNPPPNSVFTHDSFRHGQPGKVEHPTQKPIGVLSPIIIASTKPGDVILDPFCGSGSIGVAALRHGRRYVGIERDPIFAALARDRIGSDIDVSDVRARRAGQGALFSEPGHGK